jgi:hypothetical protein
MMQSAGKPISKKPAISTLSRHATFIPHPRTMPCAIDMMTIPATGRRALASYLGCQKAGLSGLNEGQVVEYEEVANKGKTSAQNLMRMLWHGGSIAGFTSAPMDTIPSPLAP